MTDAGPSTEEKSRYEALKNELKKALPAKRTADKKLAQLEVQIYNLETSYLTETAAHSGGNIIHGFEGYLKNQTTGRRKYEINEHDRVFSRSSATYLKSLELLGEGEESTATNDEFHKQSTPTLTTVIVPPAPRNQELAQLKKLRDKDLQRKKRTSVSMRSGESEDEIISAASSSSRRATKRARLADDE